MELSQQVKLGLVDVVDAWPCLLCGGITCHRSVPETCHHNRIWVCDSCYYETMHALTNRRRGSRWFRLNWAGPTPTVVTSSRSLRRPNGFLTAPEATVAVLLRRLTQ